MSRTTHLLLLAAATLLGNSLAVASIICGSGAALITGSATQFCVTDSGYSNQWFNQGPSQTPGPEFNLLGDSAQFLVYVLNGTTPVAQWLSPTVNGAATGTGFTTSSSVTNNGASEATSTISDGTVSVDIDSKVINNNIKQTFTVTNHGSDEITSMELVQYLHYFPYGPTMPTSGSLSYVPVPTLEDTYVLGLWASGTFGDPGFIRDGGVCGGPGAGPGIGCSTPDGYMIDSVANVLAAVGNVANVDLPNAAATRPMDSAGAISWNIRETTLFNGDSQAFTIELVPEPATFGLILAGGLLCCWKRRRG